jgi:hypothetical protein
MKKTNKSRRQSCSASRIGTIHYRTRLRIWTIAKSIARDIREITNCAIAIYTGDINIVYTTDAGSPGAAAFHAILGGNAGVTHRSEGDVIEGPTQASDDAQMSFSPESAVVAEVVPQRGLLGAARLAPSGVALRAIKSPAAICRTSLLSVRGSNPRDIGRFESVVPRVP